MNKKVSTIGYPILLVFCLPSFITGWTIVILSLIFYIAHKSKLGPKGVLTAQWRSWFGKKWIYSTTFGRGVIYQKLAMGSVEKAMGYPTMKHEMVHVRQIEDLNVIGFIIGAIVFSVTNNWILGVSIWASSPLWILVYYLTGWLRGGHIYRDSEHERAASAQCDIYNYESWLDRHHEKPRKWH